MPRPRKTEEKLADQKPVKLPEEKKPPISEGTSQIDPKIYARADGQKKPTHAQLELAHMNKDYTFPALSRIDFHGTVTVTVDQRYWSGKCYVT